LLPTINTTNWTHRRSTIPRTRLEFENKHRRKCQEQKARLITKFQQHTESTNPSKNAATIWKQAKDIFI